MFVDACVYYVGFRWFPSYLLFRCNEEDEDEEEVKVEEAYDTYL